MTKSALWLKHDVHFGEHPKTLRLRRLAGRNADSAEVGWWRIVESAKRYGKWTFEDEEHLVHAAGTYARFLTLYRQVGYLDELTIHNGEEYQTPLSGAERVAKHRDTSNADSVTPAVTPVTPREEKRREERADDDGRADLDAYLSVRYRPPTPAQRTLMDAYVRVFDLTGPARAARLILANPDDPIGALKADLAAFRAERADAARKSEPPKPAPKRRGSGLTGINAELAAFLREKDAQGDAA